MEAAANREFPGVSNLCWCLIRSGLSVYGRGFVHRKVRVSNVWVVWRVRHGQGLLRTVITKAMSVELAGVVIYHSLR